MNNEYLISIIVPVYNVEPFISECINSILIQSYKNFELILVNDGSTDNSPTICEQYASKDKRIKVIHKANGGLSDARNWGLKFSSGEYVVFLDSDDYWNDCDALFSLYSLLNKYSEVDVVFFRRFTFEENISQHIRYFPQFNLNKINGCEKSDVLSYLIPNGLFIPSACNKLVRRKILIDNNIWFEKGIYSEDIDWNFSLTLHADNFYAINLPFYAYRRRSGSITNSIREKNVLDLLNIIKKWIPMISEECQDFQIKKMLLGYCAYQFIVVLGIIFLAETDCRDFLLQEVRKMSYVLKYATDRKTKKVRLMYIFLGYNLSAKFLGTYIKFKKRYLF